MAFSKRHYEEIARIIRSSSEQFSDSGAGDDGAHAAISGIRVALRQMFAADNPRFDATRFDMACEPKEANRG